MHKSIINQFYEIEPLNAEAKIVRTWMDFVVNEDGRCAFSFVTYSNTDIMHSGVVRFSNIDNREPFSLQFDAVNYMLETMKDICEVNNHRNIFYTCNKNIADGLEAVSFEYGFTDICIVIIDDAKLIQVCTKLCIKGFTKYPSFYDLKDEEKKILAEENEV